VAVDSFVSRLSGLVAEFPLGLLPKTEVAVEDVDDIASNVTCLLFNILLEQQLNVEWCYSRTE
jgi:hypothetical protein